MHCVFKMLKEKKKAVKERRKQSTAVSPSDVLLGFQCSTAGKRGGMATRCTGRKEPALQNWFTRNIQDLQTASNSSLSQSCWWGREALACTQQHRENDVSLIHLCWYFFLFFSPLNGILEAVCEQDARAVCIAVLQLPGWWLCRGARPGAPLGTLYLLHFKLWVKPCVSLCFVLLLPWEKGKHPGATVTLREKPDRLSVFYLYRTFLCTIFGPRWKCAFLQGMHFRSRASNIILFSVFLKMSYLSPTTNAIVGKKAENCQPFFCNESSNLQS